jgi:hypothetical protein
MYPDVLEELLILILEEKVLMTCCSKFSQGSDRLLKLVVSRKMDFQG